jgi:hypothetical protein
MTFKEHEQAKTFTVLNFNVFSQLFVSSQKHVSAVTSQSQVYRINLIEFAPIVCNKLS